MGNWEMITSQCFSFGVSSPWSQATSESAPWRGCARSSAPCLNGILGRDVAWGMKNDMFIGVEECWIPVDNG